VVVNILLQCELLCATMSCYINFLYNYVHYLCYMCTLLQMSGLDDESFRLGYFVGIACKGHVGELVHNTSSSTNGPNSIRWVQRTLENSDDCYDMFRMLRIVFCRLHEC
jgi:hypothetical protein